MSKKSIDPKLSFLLGWLLGRRGRRQSGLGCLLMLAGAVAGIGGLMGVVSAPLSWLDARAVANLPRPAPAELVELEPGAQAIIVAQIPPDLPAGPFGLAFFYSESQVPGTDSGTPVTPSAAVSWQMERPPPERIGLTLADGTPLLVQVPRDASFLNPGRFQEAGQPARRYVGYSAGQTLSVRGQWEGNSLFTAQEFYAGAPDDYQGFLARRPGFGLLSGLICGGTGFFLLALGAVLRFLT